MFNQFFGNYLFSKGYVTKEQLLPALKRVADEQVHLAMLMLYAGTMSAEEIEDVRIMQKEQGKKFSELVIEQAYMTQDEILSLMGQKVPSFLILGQILISEGVFSYQQFSNILADYRSSNELLELELNSANKDEIGCLIEGFSLLSIPAFTAFGKSYLELIYNNFIRFIGDDFTALPPYVCKEFPTEYCVRQPIHGNYEVDTYISMDTATALAFASRYAGESFTEDNEYVRASIEDFLNMHNGLFIVNASNDHSNELTIGVLESVDDKLLSFAHTAYHFPICYSFGIVNLVIEIVEIL